MSGGIICEDGRLGEEQFWGVLIGLCYTGAGRQLRIVVSLVVPRMGERQCPSRVHR